MRFLEGSLEKRVFFRETKIVNASKFTALTSQISDYLENGQNVDTIILDSITAVEMTCHHKYL